jgi:hypothetical protein
MAKINVGSGNRGGKTPVRVSVKTGPSTAKANSPSRAAHVGRAIGNHASDAGGKTLVRPADPVRVNPNPAPFGNTKALDVGRGGPGAGRTLHGQGGSQSGPGGHSGAPSGNRQPITERGSAPRNTGSPTLAGGGAGAGRGPGSFGFRGGR